MCLLQWSAHKIMEEEVEGHPIKILDRPQPGKASKGLNILFLADFFTFIH